MARTFQQEVPVRATSYAVNFDLVADKPDFDILAPIDAAGKAPKLKREAGGSRANSNVGMPAASAFEANVEPRS
jgi:hypothetical protein